MSWSLVVRPVETPLVRPALPCEPSEMEIPFCRSGRIWTEPGHLETKHDNRTRRIGEQRIDSWLQPCYSIDSHFDCSKTRRLLFWNHARMGLDFITRKLVQARCGFQILAGCYELVRTQVV